MGDLIWCTPDGQTTRFHPLCASVVDKDDADIQRFDFDNCTDFRQWLGESLSRSSARNDSAVTFAANATRAITLVTCASDLGGQRERTVMTFVA